MELPAERDQGLGAWIRQRIDRLLEQARGRGGLLEGGLDIRFYSRQGGLRPGNDCAIGGGSVVWRQALGGSVGLSFMR